MPFLQMSDILTDFMFIIDTAEIHELELRHPVGVGKESPDYMEKAPGRPPVGIQGMILDAMDDERITRTQATELLYRVQKRLQAGREAAKNGG